MPRLSKIGAAALAAFGWTSGSSVTATYLVVAGGGGGGCRISAGGGAGGLLTGTTSLNPTLPYAVTVGAGGAGSTSNTTNGSNGSNSICSVIPTTAVGGGGAGSSNGSTGVGGTGSAGGSGGGGAGGNMGFGTGGAGTSGQGNAGGAGTTTAAYGGGGGGGAGAAGANGSGSTGGNGGIGVASSISGTSTYYAGGGGGGSESAGAGTGGSGGGGNGSSSTTGSSGTASTGGGGGGAGLSGNGGNGGSGVVIISYPGAQQFGGGNVTSSGGNTIHTFTTSGTLSPLSSLTAQYLIVAGGGGGGGQVGGGGGAGGFLTGTGVTIDTNSNYVVTVGAGGSGGVGSVARGTNGGNSVWGAVATTVLGGGAGGNFNSGSQENGVSGGSGGGGGAYPTAGTGGAGTSGQGNAGGSGVMTNWAGGGGGGASAVGANGTNNTGGAGGAGTASSISGTSVTYAGGGGGASNTVAGGAGGSGGGGAGGSNSPSTAATAGTTNLGGGGGGSRDNGNGAAGGSGIVIIAYPGSTQQMAGGTVSIVGGNVIHTFTSSGYLTPIKYASRSLRFRNSASAYLNRTFKTPTSSTTWTYSIWQKKGVVASGGVSQTLLRSANASQDAIRFSGSNDSLQVYFGGTTNGNLITSALYRDPAAWYHIVVSVNTTQATSTDRVKIYVNGVQVTAFGTASYPAQNYNTGINSAIAHAIGATPEASEFADFYLTEVNFVDGAALTPSSFGTFNSYGVWQPITYGGSYGTNGFYLTFGNNTSTTTLGYDTSPMGNNWTTNNISLTSGATYDSMLDVPTLTSATVANYAVMNPLALGSTVTLSNGNLTMTEVGTYATTVSTMAMTSGKWYAEMTAGSNTYAGTVGIARLGYSPTSRLGFQANTWSYNNDGGLYYNSTTLATVSSYTTGDVIGIAFDPTNLTIAFYKNNTLQTTQFTAANSGLTAGEFYFATGHINSTSNWNFGQQGFVYTPPSGFVALNTYNLSTPTIPNGAVYMAATTYTGNGATPNTITNGGNNPNGITFAPDMVWAKGRSTVDAHVVTDTVRGAGVAVYPNATSAEGGSGLYQFNSNGFLLNSDARLNTNAATYVAWQWKANGTGVSNTSGSITSTVSANTTAGFSVVTYTGTGSAATVGHGLGVAPSMVIVKSRTSAFYWRVYHVSLGNTNNVQLNTTNAQETLSTIWNNTSPTSSVFSIGTNGDVNTNTGNYVAYCFAAVAGYSAFGSYTGNGSTDGPFVYTGFRPRWVLVKHTNDVNSWFIWDSTRNSYNAANLTLKPNSSDAEETLYSIDVVSNGFKLRTSDVRQNTSGGTYIYMAFCENPFKYSNAR